MAGWFGQGQGYGDGGLMGKLTEDDGPTWKARLTGIPDSAPAAQGQALAMALAQAAGAIGQANQPGYGRRNTGDLLAIGMGGFGQGLGMQAMQRQRAAVEQAKAKMAEAQAQRDAEEHALKMKAGGLGGDAANLAVLLGRQPTAEEFLAYKKAQRPVTNVTTNVHNLKPGDLEPYANATNQIAAIDSIITGLEKNPDAIGLAKGVGMGSDLIRAGIDYFDPEGTGIRAEIANLGSQIIHDRSGAAVTVSEFPRLKPFVPLATDDAETALKKLKKLKTTYQQLLKSGEIFLGQSGYTVPPVMRQAAQGGDGGAGSPATQTTQNKRLKLNAKTGRIQ